ncbi:MBL fold metallo-hydrolase [Virgibacillus phasianinus]|uniref:MBL fold metallo-hydrolase n=1 Tax=Virgibacillus phasianinus TaxID=2017483 RepID=A0A220U0E7_9BACI|nr:MBL fold metallo-hydrolase [Virgibacillus phasianinus]ASK61426.1 MBL fold metallo-hydrolase [Virgibacillus phasianinus]
MDKQPNENSTENSLLRFMPMTSITSGTGIQVRNDVYYYTDQIVNICFIGTPGIGDWILIDAGMPKAASEIKSVAVDRFGRESKPAAIILTHGHFDHVGGLMDLVEEWEVPVFAHELEIPFLTGEKSYPEPDPTVEGGLVAKASRLFPNEPIDLGNSVQALPADGSVPGLEDWKWIHTPGHSPGHVSFFREEDTALISGDACITVKQDSFYNVLMQSPELNGPPRYLTTDWDAAWDSVKKLAALKPSLIVSGHGPTMEDEELINGLEELVENFGKVAIPDYGKYVDKNRGLH